MVASGDSIGVITYGMGVHWALNASKQFPGQVEILDLRTLQPADEEAMIALTKRHNKVLILTEEALQNSFAESLAGRLSASCFTSLDAPIRCIGAKDLPAVALNTKLEAAMLPNVTLVQEAMAELLAW
jgi:2-oxoisovalerate dehydrogenase E1 component